MWNGLKKITAAIRNSLGWGAKKGLQGASSASHLAVKGVRQLNTRMIMVVAGVSLSVYGVYTHTPVHSVARGEAVLRSNQWTGSIDVIREGSFIAVPGFHQIQQVSLRDQLYRPEHSDSAQGGSPFQSVEGLSLGVELAVRYALSNDKLPQFSGLDQHQIDSQIVEPVVQAVIYKAFSRYTVKEIFSSKRAEIQQLIEAELRPRLAADGITLRNVMLGKVDLPVDYKKGMERLLAEELASEKMRYTLELKEKEVQQTALESEALKVRREKEAEAAAKEQVIAARAQEEAMKHVLPFKQKQIEQRQFEAEAEKVARIKSSEGAAQARVIEAVGEADSRRKLADAEAYRQDLIGKVTSTQMEREGQLLSKHPLLIQKTMADKLSDKVSVIIAPPPADGGFIGASLLGQKTSTNANQNTNPAMNRVSDTMQQPANLNTQNQEN